MRKIFSVLVLMRVFLAIEGNSSHSVRAADGRQANHEHKYIKAPVKRKPADKDWMLSDTRTIELLEDMKKLNNEVYVLIDYFDSK